MYLAEPAAARVDAGPVRMRGSGPGRDSDAGPGLLSDGGRARASGGEPVVVKVCRGPGADKRVPECQVLLDHPVAGMPRLLDATRLPTGEQVIVMTFCSGRSLRVRSATESPPALPESWPADLDRLVTELHEAGVAHGGIDPGDVLVDHDGSVALLGFGATVRRGEEGFERARATDRSDLRRLFAEYAPASARASAVPPSHTAVSGGQALPLDRGGSGQHFDEDAWAWRELEAEPVAVPEPSVAAVLEPAYEALVEGSRGLKALAAVGARRLLRSRRRKLLVGAAVAVVTLVGALCLTVPPQDAVAEAGVAPVRSTVPGLPATPRPAAPATQTPVSASDAAEEEVLRADDPVAAAVVLLRERDSCLWSRTPGCLERVDEANSPALRLDRAAEASGDGQRTVETGGAGDTGRTSGTGRMGAPEYTGDIGGGGRATSAVEAVSAPALVQRIGATAILALDGAGGTTKPASLLMVRGEAGWRIRSFDPF
ncbi:hypothetical protein [Herbiconiux sp. YIM B11900]|uniref:hypothetical protein n=1 Tax=Herbiconiux sp. YIM B11900 TaxID=3404131 RepID=UPI003F86A693